jgi:hypothetical protein
MVRGRACSQAISGTVSRPAMNECVICCHPRNTGNCSQAIGRGSDHELPPDRHSL